MKNEKQSIDSLVILKSIQKEIAPTIKKVQGITISSQAEFAHAGEMLGKIKLALKLADAKKFELIDPLNKVVKDIRALFKPFEVEVTALEADVKSKMLTWVNKCQAAEKKLEQKFESGEIKKVSTLTAKVANLSTDNSFSQVRKVWTAVEIDGTKTPREYLVPDMPAIRDALKAGKTVKGWNWEQVDNIAI